MNNRKRQRGSERRLFEMTKGVYVEQTPFSARDNIGGVEVVAEIGWLDGRPVVDTMTITRAPDREIHTSMLRSLSLPALIARATSGGVRLWADPEGTVPFDESRQDGENLEQWAARLAYAATAMRVSAAEYVADVQKLKVSTANQRILMARKMGLIGPAARGEH